MNIINIVNINICRYRAALTVIRANQVYDCILINVVFM